MSATLTCPKCGLKVAAGAFACPRDGTLIFSEEGEEAPGQSATTQVGARAPSSQEDKTGSLDVEELKITAPKPAKPSSRPNPTLSGRAPGSRPNPTPGGIRNRPATGNSPRVTPPAGREPQPRSPADITSPARAVVTELDEGRVARAVAAVNAALEPEPPTANTAAPEPKTLTSHPSRPPSPAQPPPPPRDPLIGTMVGDYLVQSVIGEGGVGLVYRATQPQIGKTVALKVLRHEVSGNPDEVKRLLAEAKAVNAVRHRGIIDVFGFGKLPNGQQYIVMEFLEGMPLDEIVDQRAPMPLGDVLDMLDEILAALDAAHRAGVVHRDLKPNNIFQATQPDGTRYLKLLDFGLAKQGGTGGQAVPQTRIHIAVGTPEYIAPEQACGMPVSHKTDLYSLGVVAFEMITGVRPFVSENPLALLAQHVEDAPPTLASKGAAVPPALEQLVQRMLAKDPKDRPESANAVRDSLEKIRAGLAPKPPLPPTRNSRIIPPQQAAAKRPSAPGRAVTPMAPAAPLSSATRRVWMLLAVGALLETAVAGALLWKVHSLSVSPPSASAVSEPPAQR